MNSEYFDHQIITDFEMMTFSYGKYPSFKSLASTLYFFNISAPVTAAITYLQSIKILASLDLLYNWKYEIHTVFAD